MPERAAAGLPRRPTDDPSRFLIPAAQLSPGFEERVARGRGGARETLPAATVVLLRERGGVPEALLLRRPRASTFAPNAWVFPGGRVDPADRQLAAVHLEEPEAWAERLGLDDAGHAGAYVIAAAREAWEEVGILPGTRGGKAVAGAERRDGQALAVLLESGWSIGSGEFVYLGRWITPESEPRRYDTRFFLAVVPVESSEVLPADEVAQARWFTPAEALACYERGELVMLPPTVHTLRRLAHYESVEAMLTGLRTAPAPSYRPRMTAHPDGVLIVVEEA